MNDSGCGQDGGCSRLNWTSPYEVARLRQLCADQRALLLKLQQTIFTESRGEDWNAEIYAMLYNSGDMK